MARLIDHAAGRPRASEVRNAGYDGAIRYLANSPDRGLPNKILTREEADGLKAQGLEIVSNWQKTKADFEGGYDAGVRDAQEALRVHFETGGPGYRPIYFSVDKDVNLDEWNGKVLPYLNGAASVLGKEWVGVYGGQRSMWWAEEDGFRWRWQTKAWSRYDENTGKWNGNLPIQWVNGVQLRQERVDQDTVDGIGVDVNTTWADDYGQWSKAGAPVAKPEPPVSTVMMPPHERLYMFGHGYSSRNGARVLYILLHTQEGGPADGSGAVGLAGFCNGDNDVSYHEVIGAGKLIHVVPADKAAWSVLAANPYTHNVVFAGSRAGWSREQWLAREDDIRLAAWHIVGVANAAGVPVKTVNTKTPGISDHNFVTVVLGIGNHTDVGKYFPWDRFNQFLAEYNGAGAPIVVPSDNRINKEQSRAGSWLGARHGDPNAELDIAGGGKRVEYDNGQIYWHERIVDAHAIPAFLFKAYGDYGWETGELGYPVADHAVLPGGEVQAFEGGVLYRQNGAEKGFYVKGYIYAAWRQAGYENSIYGYPTSLEIPFGDSRIQHFEHGDIVWSPNGTVGLKPQDGPDQVIETKH